jgi:hypothetical protein
VLTDPGDGYREQLQKYISDKNIFLKLQARARQQVDK